MGLSVGIGNAIAAKKKNLVLAIENEKEQEYTEAEL